MEKRTVEMAMLFDLFGGLLTEKQRECFELYYHQDLSLSEIAQNSGITRQGARDLIHRAEVTLLETEEKTGLLRKMQDIEACTARIEQRLETLSALAETQEAKALLSACLADLAQAGQ